MATFIMGDKKPKAKQSERIQEALAQGNFGADVNQAAARAEEAERRLALAKAKAKRDAAAKEADGAVFVPGKGGRRRRRRRKSRKTKRRKTRKSRRRRRRRRTRRRR